MLGQDAQYRATPLTTIPGVADQTCQKLEKLNLFNFYDVILNLPFRYEDRTYIQDLRQPRSADDPCNVLLTIKTSHQSSRGKVIEFDACDFTGCYCKLVFFHAIPFLMQSMTPGRNIMAWGKIKISFYNHRIKRQMMHPQIQFLDQGKIELPSKLSPVYHLTSGLAQERMRKITASVLDNLTRHPLSEILPGALNPFNLTLSAAFLDVHNPNPDPEHKIVHLDELISFKRICYEELVAYLLSIKALQSQQKSQKATAIVLHDKVQQKLLSSLPFAPTTAQERVFKEIMDDCAHEDAMSRLVHGDVGSGKTLVAAMVMLQVAANGYQAALLAPTELLAQQHQRKLSDFFAPFGMEVGLITGSLKKKERLQLIEQAKSGSIKVFVGTHALFQSDIQYQHLALVVVDEQHRFGVEQREALLNKAPVHTSAHELLMTATPIPRSLQQTIFADSAVSTIDVMPKGRSAIITAVISQERDHEAMLRLRNICAKGQQAYWVCPLIEDSEVLEATSAKARYEALCKTLPELKIGLLHAQIKDKEKDEIMLQFLRGEINVLVATTIIEVGVDVPNATVMVIESAERLGLAQLHQLRGRVGRGAAQSYCLLMHRPAPDPELTSPVDLARFERGMERLSLMRSTLNGFAIANADLQMRGPGELFGTNQTGKENLRFADLTRDEDLIAKAQEAAKALFEVDNITCQNLIKRWFPNVITELEAARKKNTATTIAPSGGLIAPALAPAPAPAPAPASAAPDKTEPSSVAALADSAAQIAAPAPAKKKAKGSAKAKKTKGAS